MKNNLSREILAQYRSMLPYGSIKEIIDESGFHKNTIYGFFQGKSSNPEIETAILKKIAKIKNDREQLLKEAGLL